MKIKNKVRFAVVIIFISGFVMSEEKSCIAPEYRQFDFWLGNWDVYDDQGVLVGHNDIYTVLEGCAISENWTSITGSPGKSYNFYDAAESKWHQTWIDQTGGALYLDGGLVNGSMVLSGKRPGEDHTMSLERITWTLLDNGQVKQHWQSSKDDGVHWDEVFVGFYKKVEAE